MADWISLSRIAMAGLIWIWPREPLWLVAWMAAAGVSDVLDGWIARRQTARTRGEWLDPLCDKIFVASLIALVAVIYKPELWLVGLILTREALQAILVVLVRPGFDFRSAWIGKATTVVQFLAVLAILFAPAGRIPLSVGAAVLGGISTVYYFMRGSGSRRV